MIQARDITKRFGTLEVLRGVDVDIRECEVVGIVGPSGAGKTTLLQILGTLDTPDSGSVKINDVDVVKLRGKELARFRNRNIGFVFQFHQLLPEFSTLENVSGSAWLWLERWSIAPRWCWPMSRAEASTRRISVNCTNSFSSCVRNCARRLLLSLTMRHWRPSATACCTCATAL